MITAKKRFITALILTISCLLLASCSKNTDAENLTPSYSFESTVFTYNGTSYDIASREPGILSIISCTPAGQYLVVEGHCGPKHSIYCIFNTETAEFEKDIAGANLIWRDNDITTAVYSFWADIFDYNGNLIGSCDIGESDYIYDIQFLKNTIEVTVETMEGGYTTTFDLPE